MILSWNIIKQELLTIFSSITYYIEIIVVPLSLSFITILANHGESAQKGVINYIILLALYGILQGMLTGSARSLEKEKYQNTLSLHFLCNISLWKVVLNKLVASGIVGIINLVVTAGLFSLFFPITVTHYGFLAVGFVLLLLLSAFMSLVLSCIFLKFRSPYAVCSILTKFIILITGIFIPLEILPQSILTLFSLSGLPQVFSLIIYGLRGDSLIAIEYIIFLPIILTIYIFFGIKLIGQVEYKFLKKGGI